MWKTIEIDFMVWFGNAKKTAQLGQVLGMGGPNHFCLTIDGEHQGMVFKGAVWYGPDYIKWDNRKIDLTQDDVQALVDRIEQAFTLERMDITITGVFGEHLREVAIFEVSPWSFEVRMCRDWEYYHLTRITRINGKWTGEIKYGAWNYITSTDIEILGEIIQDYKEARTDRA